MPPESFDRRRIKFNPLRDRRNKVAIEADHVPAAARPVALSHAAEAVVRETAARMVQARESDAACMLTFGAHTIKNGLAPVLIKLLEEGWITHLATNGAGIIHDWEFAHLGESSEDVRENLAAGRFGAWEETGYFLNLALALGAYDGLGYGASVGRLIEEERLVMPERAALLAATADGAAADLREKLDAFEIKPGMIIIPHPFKRYSVQAAAYRAGVPFTGHPMIGHDIIYEHPMSCGAAIGRTAERDFLRFATSVSKLSGGAYISLGSAVMSPMIFEKALSMARNVAHQNGQSIDDTFIAVVDIASSDWDWSQGEPPEDNPAYYQRYNKTFARAGGDLRVATADNRDFLTALLHALAS